MSRALPDRPDLAQLRRQAKELRDAARGGDAAALARFAGRHRPAAVSLAAAQLVIAREHGFGSWPSLKAAVVARHAVAEFLAASVGGRLRQAGEALRADPGIAGRGLLAATVLGDVTAVRAGLAADPDAAVAVDDERGWPPLLYLCYSHWHRIDPGRVPGMAEVARLLLAAGANPNTNDGGRGRFRSALKGSVEVGNPAITEALLDAGARPDLGQPIGEAAGRRDHRCLELLLAHGARVAGTWALGAAIAADDAVAVSLLLAAGAPDATDELPEAAANASLPVVLALLAAGADPDAADDGVSALRRAIRAGRLDTATRLRAAGATDDATDVDRLVGACHTGDRQAVERLLAGRPDLLDRLTDADRAVIFDVTTPQAVTLVLELGFSPAVRNGFGEQPLHTAAYLGNAAVVRALLAGGADVDARDHRFDATPLAFATVGSGERAGRPGDWLTTVRVLIDAGASRDGVWISGKPPSEEVADLLRRYGIAPDEPAEPDEPPAGSVGTGVLADIADHLETAYRDRDLDLLGSLLHPDVRWTGECTDRAQVLDWYRKLIAAGTTATVHGVEVDRDAVVLELAVADQAEGARPAPPQRLHQVFTVEDALIVDIRGYPDRASALART